MRYRITADITIADEDIPDRGLRMGDIRDALDGGSAGGVTAYVDAVRSMMTLTEPVTAQHRIQDALGVPRSKETHVQPDDYIDIVFDGPPDNPAPRFVEVEDHQGHGIRVGRWLQRPDGYWALRLPR